MIRLTSTFDKLQALLAGAVTTNQLQIVACYSDKTSTDYSGLATRVNTNGTTAVDVVGAPAAATIRDIDLVNVYQRDTVSATLTLRVDIAGTDYILGTWTLSPGDCLTYTHSGAWHVVDVNGKLKTINVATKADVGLGNVDNTSDATKNAAAVTLTNKRITARVGTSAANSATPAINSDNFDVFRITGQTAAITSMTTNLTGTPVDSDVLLIEITGTGAVAITWGASFEASTVALPATTVGTAKLTTGFLWNAVTNKWRCLAVA